MGAACCVIAAADEEGEGKALRWAYPGDTELHDNVSSMRHRASHARLDVPTPKVQTVSQAAQAPVNMSDVVLERGPSRTSLSRRPSLANAFGRKRGESSAQLGFDTFQPDDKALVQVAKKRLLFDAHCHYLDYMQHTEGLDVLSAAMDRSNVGFAALTGCPLKKAHLFNDQPAPLHPLHDDGELYHYSMTDGLLTADMKQAAMRHGKAFTGKFVALACGFNLADCGAAAEATRLVSTYPYAGLGELTLLPLATRGIPSSPYFPLCHVAGTRASGSSPCSLMTSPT